MATKRLWHKLGLTLAQWADQNFLLGVGQLFSDIYQIVLDATGLKALPVNWECEFHKIYTGEDSILWVKDPEGQLAFLPQVVIINSTDNIDESFIKLELTSTDFKTPFYVREGLEFYRRGAKSGERKIFFDGTNARLLNWDAASQTLTFQGSSYFDYLQTNLSIDIPIPILGSLRKHITVDGKLELLSVSILANATGINGLIFSNDGYMIFQKRRKNVLIRPGELCSGFSGTIDKIDIEHAIRQTGTLSSLDAPREMVEELGIRREEIAKRSFLGITRELIRGGAPEMFFAFDVDVSARHIIERIPKDKEGIIYSVLFGPYACADFKPGKEDKSAINFWPIVEITREVGDGPISIPLLTNLILWYQRSCPSQAGIGAIPKISMQTNRGVNPTLLGRS